MASDNLTAAAAGALGSVNDLLSEYVRASIGNKFKKDYMANEMELKNKYEMEQLPVKKQYEFDILGKKAELEKGQTDYEYGQKRSFEDRLVDVYDPLDAKVRGKVMASAKELEQPKVSGSGVGERAKQNLIIRYQNGLNSDTLFKQSQSVLSELKGMDKLLAEARAGNQNSFSQAKAAQAKIVEGGARLTDKDVERYVGSGALSRKIVDKLNLLYSGKPSDFTLDELEAVNKAYKEKAKSQVGDIINFRADQMARNLDISVDEAKNYLAEKSILDPTSEQVPNVPVVGGQSSLESAISKQLPQGVKIRAIRKK